MSEWISVEERLPEVPERHLHAERPVLVVDGGKVVAAFLCVGKPTGHRTWNFSQEHWSEKHWFSAENANAYERLNDVTHWQPLPPPPQGEQA